MKRHVGTAITIALALLIGATTAGCVGVESDLQMANPASVHCEEQGGTLEIRTADDGGQVGYCVFDDGTECEEWAFMRGDCAPGEYESYTGLANPASVYCEEQGGTLEIRTADDGGQMGFCLFDDGTECEEWAFFRNECEPGAE